MEHEYHEHEDHACECDHHHETSAVTNHEGITVSHHEGAIICSAKLVVAKEYEWVKDTLASELKSLADWVEDHGGIVGHIKAFLTEQGYSSMLSTTGEDVHVKETRKPKVTVNIAIIVFIKNEKQLCLKLAELLEKFIDTPLPLDRHTLCNTYRDTHSSEGFF